MFQTINVKKTDLWLFQSFEKPSKNNPWINAAAANIKRNLEKHLNLRGIHVSIVMRFLFRYASDWLEIIKKVLIYSYSVYRTATCEKIYKKL